MLHREPGEVDPMPRIGPIIGQLAGTFMRYVSERRARDFDWYGVRVPAGSVILLLTGSAGRDERQYADPDRFDVERDVGRHLSLGYGTHFCLGASLARLEARVALEEVLARFPRWDVDWSGARRVTTSTVRGFARLPIHF